MKQSAETAQRTPQRTPRRVAIGLATLLGLGGTVAVSNSSVFAQTTPSAYDQAVRADGATSYWRLGEQAGATNAVDSIGTRTATFGSGTLGTPGALTGDADTAVTSASGNMIETMPVPTGARTIEAWVKVPDSLTFATLFSHGYLGVNIGPDGTPQFSAGNPMGSGSFSPLPINDGQWHHVVLAVGGSSASLYVDSVLLSTQDNTDYGPEATIRIGSLGHSTDELAYYPTNLTADQVRRHWHVGMAGQACASSTGSSSYEQSIAADGATSHWRFENAGRLAIDQIGCRSSRVAGTATSGIANSSGRLANINGTFTVSGIRTGARSLEAWVKPPVGSSYSTLIGHGYLSASLNSTGTVELMGSGSYGFTSSGALPSPVINDGEWHHIVLVVSSTTVSLYVDSILVSVQDYTDYANEFPLRVGDPGHSVDEVAVYPVALTTAQVRNHWFTGMTGQVCAPVTPTSTYETSVAADGAASHWRIDGTGRLAVDQIGCRSGLLSGTVTAGAIAADASTARSATGFGGLQVSGIPTGTRTIEAWIKTPVGALYNTLFGQGYLNVALDATGAAVLNGGGAPGTQSIYGFGGMQVNDGQWHHFALVIKPGEALLYVDSVLTGSQTNSDYSPEASLWIGSSGHSVDEVAIYPTALDAQQVGNHWHAGLAGQRCTPVRQTSVYEQAVQADSATSHWRLESSTGRLAVDKIGCRSGLVRGTSTPGSLSGESSTGRTSSVTGGLVVSAIPTGTRTLEAWVKTPVGAQYGTLIRQGYLYVDIDFSGYARLPNTGISSSVYPQRVVNDSAWHHLAVAINQTTVFLYVDGQLVQAADNYDYSPADVLAVGSPSYSIDEVAVYAKTLTAAEVLAHYEIGATGSSVGPTTSTTVVPTTVVPTTVVPTTVVPTTEVTTTVVPPTTVTPTTVKPTTTRKPTTVKPTTTKRPTTTRRVTTTTRRVTTTTRPAPTTVR
jgi:hypothetical protein